MEASRSESLEFQFLIGTLKTSIPDSRADREMAVSIPDRYAKNKILPWVITDSRTVSIPDRYAKNFFAIC